MIKLISKKAITVLTSFFLVLGIFALAMPPAHANSVYDYAITSATQTAPDTIVVSAQCEFCGACNPNDPGSADYGPGCDPFEPGEPWVLGSGYHTCGAGYPDGRFAAVRLISSMHGWDVTQKLVCDTTNWPLETLWAHNFVFTGLTVDPADTITAYADFYCSYCYHWYSDPVIVELGIPEPECEIVYKTTDSTVYDFGDVVEVEIEVDPLPPLTSYDVVVDASLIDPNGVVQDYDSWTGTIIPGPDPITLYLDIPPSGTPGTWTVFVTVLNMAGEYQDSEPNDITVAIPPVIPEYPLGTIMAVLAFSAALAVFVRSKRYRLPAP